MLYTVPVLSNWGGSRYVIFLRNDNCTFNFVVVIMSDAAESEGLEVNRSGEDGNSLPSPPSAPSCDSGIQMKSSCTIDEKSDFSPPSNKDEGEWEG